MHPVILTDTAWIDHMGEIVFGVGKDEIRVRDGIVGVRRPRFGRRRNTRSSLDRLDRAVASRQADESPSKRSSQRRRTAGVSRAGSVVTKTSLI